MTLYKYFQRDSKKDSVISFLPDEAGPLSINIPSKAIRSANEEVTKVIKKMGKAEDRGANTGSRGQYESFTSIEKASIARYALEVGVTKAIRKLERQFPERKLKEPTVRSWVNKYKMNLRRNQEPLKHLMDKNRGRPLLLGSEMDDLVHKYVVYLREKGGVINSAIVISAAIGIVKSRDSNLLKSNGGHIELTKSWALSLLQRMGFVKRRNTTKSKVTIADFEEKKMQFLFDIKAIIEMEEIPPELVINWDHTGINYIPVSNWTMEKEGAKRVEIFGVQDKRQMTVVFAGTMTGHFLPPQLIYAGKTKKCLPTVSFPKSWDVLSTPKIIGQMKKQRNPTFILF